MAPMVTVKKPPMATTPTATATLSENAAVQGLSGVTSHYVSVPSPPPHILLFTAMMYCLKY